MLGGKRRSSKKCISKSKAQCRSANRKCKFSRKTRRCGSRKSRRKSRKSKKSKKSRKSRKSRKSIRCGARKKSKTCKSAKKTCKWSNKNKKCSSRKKKSRRKSRKSCRSKTEKQCRKSTRKCNYNEETKRCRSNPRKKKLPRCPWNAKKDKCLKGKRSEHCKVVLNDPQRRCARKVLEELTSLDTEQQDVAQALALTDDTDINSLTTSQMRDMLGPNTPALLPKMLREKVRKLLTDKTKNDDDSDDDSNDDNSSDTDLTEEEIKNYEENVLEEDIPYPLTEEFINKFIDEITRPSNVPNEYLIKFLRRYLSKYDKNPFGPTNDLLERFKDLLKEDGHKFNKIILMEVLKMISLAPQV